MLIEHLPVDEDLYRKITKISYSEHVPLEKLINGMLKEYLNVYLLSKKIGYALISKDVLKVTFSNTPKDQVIELSRKIATRYREAAILLHGKPSLEAYICLIKSFVNANGYYIEFSKNPIAVGQQEESLKYKQEAQQEESLKYKQEAQQQQERIGENKTDVDSKNKSDDFKVMIIQFNVSYKFSQFLGNVYRILLDEFCTINRFELTERLVFYEYIRK